ncbi:glycosyltransferase family 2 protein [Cellulomonas sp.]|uniref:glycosyltransferase family 2 protein n=1 Tax=Cellulomonas sp. TaxID=40001 RepID=UPI002D74F654|nr:glycosyltransferase family 2 protein [Cellulomonas sp.]HYQ74910.1 glycosyltransferase family 2 protein [Cellulomonas sp.]
MTAPAGALARTERVRPRPVPTADATVTVVVPCHDYARYLPAAVGSALDQAGVLVDVVVVDDASADDSLAVAARLAAADPRVTVVAHARNRGPVETFNDGLARATGEFLVRLDADDLLTPGSLARSVALARAYPSVGLVYGHPVHFAGEPPGAARTRARRWTVWPGRRWLADRCADGYNVITSPEVLMRGSVVAAVGGQRPLAHAHDMEMWLRLAAHADVAHVGGADQAWHREHAASLSAREVDDATDFRERVAAFAELAAAGAAGLPERDDLAAAARRALVRQALRACRYEVDRGRRDPGRVRRLMAEALVVAPELAGPWQRLDAALDAEPGALGRAAGLARAVRVRADDVRRGRRWARTGTYTRDGARGAPRLPPGTTDATDPTDPADRARSRVPGGVAGSWRAPDDDPPTSPGAAGAAGGREGAA